MGHLVFVWLDPAIDSVEAKGSWLCFDEADWAVGEALSTLGPELGTGEIKNDLQTVWALGWAGTGWLGLLETQTLSCLWSWQGTLTGTSPSQTPTLRAYSN